MMIPEVAEYAASIRRQRDKVFETLERVGPDGWDWTPTNEETNSLYVLATHCIGSEHGWIYEILGRGAKTRVRSKEFQARGRSLGELRATYTQVAEETDSVLAGRTEADLSTTRVRENADPVSERWILLHVIEHYSEHLGQMYLTAQLWESRGSEKNA
jgi:uncharacterized damage-inducible protein DinB